MQTAINSSAIAPISVSNSTDLSPIFYKDQPVITMSMIDKAHQRPHGTAKRNFRSNRQHLVPGDDYFEINQADEIRTLGFSRPQGGTPDKIYLFSETGYLMLVKSFTDDLAWQVQRKLVKSYFRAQERRPTIADFPDFTLSDLTTRLVGMVPPMLKTHSLRQAYVIANSMLKADTGIDVLSHWPISLDELDNSIPLLPGRKPLRQIPAKLSRTEKQLERLASYLRHPERITAYSTTYAVSRELIADLLAKGYIARQVLLKRMHCTAAEFNLLIAEGKEAGIVRELDGIEFNYAGTVYVAGGAA